jgi:hypothetical protein
MKKVTGIGGIFFKCKDPQKVKDWYSKNLGLQTDEVILLPSSKKMVPRLNSYRLSNKTNRK